MVDEEIPADLSAGMNVDGGQETGQVVDCARKEVKAHPEQAMGDTVPEKRPHAGVQKDFPTRARGRIALDD
ncbi:hypothetical protein GCM10011371_24230 [Novosphingobium marinum]|nr:hypothetical protein GCM10011371_24230 [Novosphingobium marinum]